MKTEDSTQRRSCLSTLRDDRLSRRDLIRGLAVSASASVVGYLLTGKPWPVLGSATSGDVEILSAALYLEHEAIAAYQAGAESTLLSKEVVKVAVAFQSDHKYHRDGIS